MITEHDQPYLRRAKRLAMNGRGHVEPNPMVGCVIVKNGQVIGEGWHQKYGQPHAEPNALNDCRARGNDPAGATAYVTLEPCCHTNKQTPPCAPRLIEAKIARVVIGCLDPNPDVNGKGVAMLRNAGIQVDTLSDRGMGLKPMDQASQVENPCHDLDASHFRQLIAPFILRQCHRRPYVTLKWAESADGKVAGAGGGRTQISNAASSHFVQQLRSRSDSMMVGVNTVLNDDPSLTIRVDDPYRRLDEIYILDSAIRTPPNARLFLENGWVTIVFAADHLGYDGRLDRLRPLIARSQTTSCPIEPEAETGRVSLAAFFEANLGEQEAHCLVEAGPTLARSFFASNFCDRLIVIRSPVSIGNPTAPAAAVIPDHYVPTAILDLAGDTLTEYLNTRSPAFFAPTPSADFVLAAESVARATSP